MVALAMVMLDKGSESESKVVFAEEHDSLKTLGLG